MASEAGFKITIRPMEFASLLRERDEGKFDAVVIGWSGRPDPDGNIHVFQTCKGSLSVTLACDADIDALLNKAREVSGFKERYALYREATEKILARRSLIYLYHLKYIVGLRKNVSGYVATPDGLIRALGVDLN
jgi:peptide/nickel transport system substrate-binding protein